MLVMGHDDLPFRRRPRTWSARSLPWAAAVGESAVRQHETAAQGRLRRLPYAAARAWRPDRL